MQRTLDAWGAGVSIVEVQIRSVNPPQEVVAAFRDVQSAEQDRDSAVNEANTYRNRVVNEAKGDAAKIIQSAQGYREQSVRDGDRRRGALQLDLQRVPPRAAGHPRPPLHRDHGAGAGALQQGGRRPARASPPRSSCRRTSSGRAARPPRRRRAEPPPQPPPGNRSEAGQ